MCVCVCVSYDKWRVVIHADDCSVDSAQESLHDDSNVVSCRALEHDGRDNQELIETQLTGITYTASLFAIVIQTTVCLP